MLCIFFKIDEKSKNLLDLLAFWSKVQFASVMQYFSKRMKNPQVFWICVFWEPLMGVALNVGNIWENLLEKIRSWLYGVCHETYKYKWTWKHTFTSLQVTYLYIKWYASYNVFIFYANALPWQG